MARLLHFEKSRKPETSRPAEPTPARVVGIYWLRWKRYGEWRRRQIALKHSEIAGRAEVRSEPQDDV